MANTSSAKKAARKIEARSDVNKSRVARVRTYVRKVEEAIAAGDKDKAGSALHKNTASRKVSRLSARVKTVGA